MMLDPKLAVRTGLQQHLEAIQDTDDANEDPFFVCDLGHVDRQYKLWRDKLPSIKPFYAVKCNSDSRLIQELAALGTGFDCASRKEMEIVLDKQVDPSRIIFANPCKAKSCLKFARSRGVAKMTFDNADELLKISEVYPGAELFLRVLANDLTALTPLGDKFGASVAESLQLLELAKDLNLNVVGVSFHVGSGFKDVGAFDKAIGDSRKIWDQGLRLGFDMHTLDIGGGFSEQRFLSIAPAVGASIDFYFGTVQPLQVIAEPGRFFAEGAYTVACCVIAKRCSRGPVDVHERSRLYLSDGVFGDFANVFYEHLKPVPRILRLRNLRFTEYLPEEHNPDTRRKMTKFSLWGPTCDSHDNLRNDCLLPDEVGTGDWLYFEDAGAYSLATSTNFNGFKNSRQIVYVR